MVENLLWAAVMVENLLWEAVKVSRPSVAMSRILR